ncbi:translation initiation factor IF-2 [candidate division WOR-3 bacterium]|uniref:Translation initiation factor IF-2 n=1 Tax=candidate division WOR-3 bacterium TaxID=2052148 RepID=A0A9D5K839_UNCW3|nr:translation initiation factor IF-2 [candidate division WOR-3 bacterium]MBD3364007.1 translation initiation factor IF-2 [candidate division WOR-3 bacterium]
MKHPQMKLFEAAEKLRLSSEALARMMKELGFKPRGYTSYITDEEFEAVKNRLRKEKQKIKQSMKKAKPAERGKRKHPRKYKRGRRDQDQIEKAVKQTLARMDHKRSRKKTSKRARPARKHRREEEKKHIFEPKRGPAIHAAREATVSAYMSVSELGQVFKVPPAEIIKRCVQMGVFVTINERLDLDTISVLAEEFGVKITVEEEPAIEYVTVDVDDECEVKPRPPVVVVLGHVDHGKTTLLDYIRQTRVASQEAGRITQRIGAYTAQIKDYKIIFLDTPGHEAFTAMRARGASVADIAILVVAADDGVKPQTIEAIDHAKAADLPIIAAVTKSDLEIADPDKVKGQLSSYDVIAEDYGGKVITIEVSGITGDGVDDLLDAIQVTAIDLNLKAPYEGRARAVVVESKLDKSKGSVTTLIVQRGTLTKGDPYICSEWCGRVREMMDESGNRLKEATPGTPVQILGIGGIPEPGETFDVVESERAAKDLAQRRRLMHRERALASSSKLSLEALQEQIKSGNVREMRIILKGDVFGSVEAISSSLEELSIENVKVKVIHAGVGAINVTDVNLAEASGAVIVGFHVTAHADARSQAEREGVEIRTYKVIYDVIDDVRAAMLGMLEPEEKEVILGRGEVRQVFTIPKVGTIAGSYISEGKVTSDAKVRVYRGNDQLTETGLASLQRFDKSVGEVESGYECGIRLEEFNDIEEGDRMEFFTIIQRARTN